MTQKKKKREKVTFDDWIKLLLMISLCMGVFISGYIEYGPNFLKHPDFAISLFSASVILVISIIFLSYFIYLTIKNRKNKK